MAVEAAPRREIGFGGEKVAQEGFVDLNRGVGPGEARKTWDLAGRDELLCRPNVVGSGPSEEIRPVGVLSSFDRLEIPLP